MINKSVQSAKTPQDVQLAPNVLAEMCPSRDVLRHITGRWSPLIFWVLKDKKQHRFSEIRKSIQGISEKMLAQTLKDLEHDGFVLRTVHPVVPPHVEYQLTPLGEAFGQQVELLIQWIEENLEQVLNNRQSAAKAEAS